MAKGVSNSRIAALKCALLGCAALMPVSAHAQQAAAGGQRSAANSNTEQEDASSPDIIVTGVRGSIQRAQDIKRNAQTIVEAITFEDLGKFSDPSIADALQRVPGLQIQRNDQSGSGDRVSIRGLGPGFVSVTVNGRESLSYGDIAVNQRQFNFDAIPSESLAGVLVYKTSSAQLVEPGIAGQVDLRTLRPLDYKSQGRSFGGISGQGSYDDISKEWSPRVSGYLGTKLLDDTLGIYVSGLWSKSNLRSDSFTVDYVSRTLRTINSAGAITSTPNILAPSIENFSVNLNKRERIAASAAIQYKPDDHLNINIDFLYNRYKINQDNPNLRFSSDTVGTTASELPTGAYQVRNGALVYIDTSRAVSSLPSDNQNNPGGYTYVVPQNVPDDRTINQYNGGANIEWKDDDWLLRADYSYSGVDVKSFNIGGGVFAPESEFIYDGTDSSRPNTTILSNLFTRVGESSVDAQGVRNWTFPLAYVFGNSLQLKSHRNAIAGDVERKFYVGQDFELKLKAGVRYAATTLDYRAANWFDLFGPVFGYPVPRFPDGSVIPGGITTPDLYARAEASFYNGRMITAFPGGNYGGYNGSVTFPVVSLRGLCDVGGAQWCGYSGRRNAFTQSSFTGAFPTTRSSSDPVTLDAGGTYLINEKNLGIYGQLDWKGNLGSLPFDGAIGIRAVRISERTQGFGGSIYRNDRVFNLEVAPPQLNPVNATNSYWQFLPSLAANFHPSSNSTIRFNVARTMTLPEYAQLSPSSNVVVYTGRNPNGTPSADYDPTRLNDGSGGNPYLKPITSWNYDLTGEYYTRSGGAIIVGLFYKDIKNFIVSTTSARTVPGFGSQLFNVTSPVNLGDGYTRGFEIAVNQPFTFLSSPFDGLGFQGAYTFVDSAVKTNGLIGGAATTAVLPGASKHNINAILYFEKWGFSFRAAYNYRTEFLQQPPLAIANTAASLNGYTRPESRVDLSSSYAITRGIEIYGSATNITGQGRLDYLENQDIFRGSFTRPRTYTIGVRAKF